MKKLISLMLCILSLAMLLPSAVAENVLYRVDSYEPLGYCYMYDRPTSTYGNNLKRFENGEVVLVCGQSGDFYQITEDGVNVAGYISCSCLVKADEQRDLKVYYVNSIEPYGYCYMYDRPSSTYGDNMGKLVNGQEVTILDWDADKNYAYVCSWDLVKLGYIRKACLTEVGTTPAEVDTAVVYNARGYAYLYDRASSTYGDNLGRYENGYEVIILNWYADANYAKVSCQGKEGYMGKDNLSRVQ